jgi:hypothetical protein
MSQSKQPLASSWQKPIRKDHGGCGGTNSRLGSSLRDLPSPNHGASSSAKTKTEKCGEQNQGIWVNPSNFSSDFVAMVVEFRSYKDQKLAIRGEQRTRLANNEQGRWSSQYTWVTYIKEAHG